VMPVWQSDQRGRSAKLHEGTHQTYCSGTCAMCSSSSSSSSSSRHTGAVSDANRCSRPRQLPVFGQSPGPRCLARKEHT
jgi:hypothetical protein